VIGLLEFVTSIFGNQKLGYHAALTYLLTYLLTYFLTDCVHPFR